MNVQARQYVTTLRRILARALAGCEETLLRVFQ